MKIVVNIFRVLQEGAMSGGKERILRLSDSQPTWKLNEDLEKIPINSDNKEELTT